MGYKGDAIRQRIVAAADELFYQKGYEHTSFHDIADVLGISRGNFYYHFKTKDEILHAVINARVIRIETMLSEWDEKFVDPKRRLHIYIDTLTLNLDGITSYGCPIGSLCTELAKVNHVMLHDVNKLFVVFRDWIITQLKKLGVSKNSKQIAMHILARTQGIASISNAFADKAFLQKEVKLLKQWLDSVVSPIIHQTLPTKL